MELERLDNSAGPTVGRLMRPSDGKTPKSIAFIQCVGSRDERYNEYCSGFCCMYTIKNALLLEADATRYGYHHLLHGHPHARPRAMKSSTTAPARWASASSRGGPRRSPRTRRPHNLFIEAEDQALGQVIELETEMVVLSTAAIPRADTEHVGSTLNLIAQPGRLFHGVPPEAAPGGFAHGRRLPGRRGAGAQGHPRQRGPGQRGGLARRARPLCRHLGDRAHRGQRLAGALHQRPGQKVRHLRHHVPLRRHHRRAGPGGAGHPGQVPRLRRLRGRVPARRHHPGRTLPTRRSWPSCTRCWRDKPEEKILAFMCHWCSLWRRRQCRHQPL